MGTLQPFDLPADALAFLTERHLATLSTVRPDGSLHVVPVGFTFDETTATVRVICSGDSRKVRNVEAGSRAVVCQVDGARWLSLEGSAVVMRGAPDVADATARYTLRYREPRVNPKRVAMLIRVDRILGSAVPRPA
jgi:F420H(2)-dependent biliverdin reductase